MDVVNYVLTLSGYKSLNPVQSLALEAGLLLNKNLVIAAPTASGKTLIAEIAAIATIRKGQKVIYIVPLRALASEKYEEFRQKYSKIGIKVAISIGDYDSSDPWLANYDLIIVTSEKFDSLLRHGINWIDQIGLVVVDEIHLLNSPDRGPTLEILITKLRQVVQPQILGLSATISNYKELAAWLGAQAVYSEWRPVKLYRGIAFGYKVELLPKKEIKLDPELPTTLALVLDTIRAGKQVLFFLSTRKSAEAMAENLAKTVQNILSEKERNVLKKLADRVFHVLEYPTKQCKRLAACIAMGTAFHHAGLPGEQRRLIENAFRSGDIKIITATPTLAAGVNLPAFRVLIRDLRRFSHYHGMSWIPVLEIEQMMGRAGRPQYDSEGHGILLAKDKSEAKFAWENYILGKPEAIKSKLGLEPVLRTHILGLIASGIVNNIDGLIEFFSQTFYAKQYGHISALEQITKKILKLLSELDFIKIEDGKISPTKIGKRVTELYIDPLSAAELIKGIKKWSTKNSDFHLLYLISNCIELKPGPNVGIREKAEINNIIAKYEQELKPPQPWDIEWEDFLRAVKMSTIFSAWCNEIGEDMLLEKYRITPGELRARLEIADWLLYSATELGLLLGKFDFIKAARKLRIRLQYGVKAELLPLVRLKGIGRIRARLLYNAGLKKLADLRKVPTESLAKLVGPKIAADIKEQLNIQM
jgi:helicase